MAAAITPEIVEATTNALIAISESTPDQSHAEKLIERLVRQIESMDGLDSPKWDMDAELANLKKLESLLDRLRSERAADPPGFVISVKFKSDVIFEYHDPGFAGDEPAVTIMDDRDLLSRADVVMAEAALFVKKWITAREKLSKESASDQCSPEDSRCHSGRGNGTDQSHPARQGSAERQKTP